MHPLLGYGPEPTRAEELAAGERDRAIDKAASVLEHAFLSDDEMMWDLICAIRDNEASDEMGALIALIRSAPTEAMTAFRKSCREVIGNVADRLAERRVDGARAAPNFLNPVTPSGHSPAPSPTPAPAGGVAGPLSEAA